MILLWIVLLPLLGGLLAALIGRWSPRASRWTALGVVVADLLHVLGIARTPAPRIPTGALVPGAPSLDAWRHLVDWMWIPEFGVGLRLGLDGLSTVLLVLTFGLGAIAIVASWREIERSVGFYHLNLLWTLAGIAGVFLTLDLLLLYFFWELMLVPMFLLIAIWGHENRRRAALKFFLFTQAGGVLLLVAILGLGLGAEGGPDFSYLALLAVDVPGAVAPWLFAGFFLAFAVKLPVVGLHTWLPDAHTEAPTAGSVILAGLLLKTGAYGLLRFALPLFPDVARTAAAGMGILAAAGILYGGWMALAQEDLKRLVAYSSVAHLGFVLLGLFAWTRLAWHGAVLQMIAHGLSTGALFLLVGMLGERLGTRRLDAMGGLRVHAPRMAAAGTFFAMASLGLPGLGNFVAEIQVLLGAFPEMPGSTAVAAVGIVFATAYSLRIVQRVFHGDPGPDAISDLRVREAAVLLVLAGALLWLGLAPQPVLDSIDPSIAPLVESSSAADPEPPTLARGLP